MSAGLIALIGLCGLIVLGTVVILVGTSGRSNSWPALGTNLPAEQSGFGMTWWKRQWIGSRPSVSVPDAEEAMGPHYDILTVDHQLGEMAHHRRHTAASWMDEPGALEDAGMVDAPVPDDSTHYARHPSPRRRHRRRS